MTRIDGKAPGRVAPGKAVGPLTQLRVVMADGDRLPAQLEALIATARPAIGLRLEQALDAALASDAAAPVLVLLGAPRASLRGALALGVRPADALEGWIERTAALLGVCRKARRRVVLCEIDAFAVDPAAMAAPLAARLGVVLSAALPPLAPAPADAAQDLLDMLAAGLLAAEPRATALLDEIEAMTTGPVSPLNVGRDVAMRVLAVQQRLLGAGVAGKAQLSDPSMLAEEMDLQRDAIRLAHAEIERAGATTAALEVLLDASSEGTQRQFEQQERIRARREEVLGAMLLARDALLGDAEQLREELSSVYVSRSWRLTRPVRALTRRLRPAR
ncbi:MAG: hypothetical protein ACK4LQ_07535 [Pararhodobacter sp.]